MFSKRRHAHERYQQTVPVTCRKVAISYKWRYAMGHGRLVFRGALDLSLVCEHRSARPLSREVQTSLFVPFRMLFSPQSEEERRHLGRYRYGAMNLGMTARAKGNHQAQYL